MKKNVFIALCLTGSVALAQEGKSGTAGTGAVAASQPYPNAPEITFTKSEHDFGTVKKGEPMRYKFQFKNTGKEDLLISNCRGGCECTQAKCPKEPIKPGKTDFIEVNYDSTRVGKFGKEVMVHSNARKPVIFLLIRGNVEDPGETTSREAPVKTPIEKSTE